MRSRCGFFAGFKGRRARQYSINAPELHVGSGTYDLPTMLQATIADTDHVDMFHAAQLAPMDCRVARGARRCCSRRRPLRYYDMRVRSRGELTRVRAQLRVAHWPDGFAALREWNDARTRCCCKFPGAKLLLLRRRRTSYFQGG
jgi:hypothetical protein